MDDPAAPKPPDATPNPRYVAALAMRVAELQGRVQDAETQLASLRERLRSPRHRIAEALGDALQRIPVIRPLLARVTGAVLRREERRRRAGA